MLIDFTKPRLRSEIPWTFFLAFWKIRECWGRCAIDKQGVNSWNRWGSNEMARILSLKPLY